MRQAITLIGNRLLESAEPIEEGTSGVGQIWWRCRRQVIRKNSRSEDVLVYELEIIRFDQGDKT